MSQSPWEHPMQSRPYHSIQHRSTGPRSNYEMQVIFKQRIGPVLLLFAVSAVEDAQSLAEA